MHYGLAQDVRKAREEVLRVAYEAHPERFVRKIPVPPAIPEAAWINKPKPASMSEPVLH
jgi:putative transposase